MKENGNMANIDQRVDINDLVGTLVGGNPGNVETDEAILKLENKNFMDYHSGYTKGQALEPTEQTKVQKGKNVLDKIMQKMKNRNLNLILLLLIFCSYIKLEAKPKITTYIYANRAYGIIEDGKVNRIGIPKDKIYQLYGIMFNHYYQLEAPTKENRFKNHYIKFYNDIKFIINGKEYIISKEQIKIDPLNSKDGLVYPFEPPIDIRNTKDNDLIIDIGEIEILDKEGNIIKPKTKIPPILFKKTYLTIKYNNIKGTDQETLYRGWAEDFPEDLRQMLIKYSF
ncbi:hypothetical protein [Fusobacterium ulcerans]|nr:hypothetical protein [Fusobacterium ulcerans]